MVGIGRAVHHLLHPMGIDRQLKAVRPLGAELALVDWAVRIALDIDDLSALGVDVQPATHGAVGAYAMRQRRALRPRRLLKRLPAKGLQRDSAIRTGVRAQS